MAHLINGLQGLLEVAPNCLRGAQIVAYAPRSPELVEALAYSASGLRIVVAEASQQAYWSERIARAKVEAIDILAAAQAPADLYDVALLMPHKDRELTYAYAAIAAQQVKVGGLIIVVGAKDEGVEPLEKRLADQFEKLNRAVLKPLGRGSIYRKTAAQPAPVVNTFGFTATFAEHALEIKTLPGVFGKKGYDIGTQNLLRAIEVKPGERVLDLGCGPGTVGLLLQKAHPTLRVTLSDDDANAVACARSNAAAAGLTPEAVILSDGLSSPALQGQLFDLIALNPPFHQGQDVSYAIADRLCRQVATALAPAGRFYMVANQFCPYEKILRELWSSVEIIHTDRSYKVWRCS